MLLLALPFSIFLLDRGRAVGAALRGRPRVRDSGAPTEGRPYRSHSRSRLSFGILVRAIQRTHREEQTNYGENYHRPTFKQKTGW